MHGLVNRSLQRFVSDRYGAEVWLSVTVRAGLDFSDFEGMLIYHEDVTEALLTAMTRVLDRPRTELMEDIGTFLVSDQGFEAVRRLLRFGGTDFVDFLQSLNELPDRTRLAVSDLHLPRIDLITHDTRSFTLVCDAKVEGYGHLLLGLLRAMADDYGALALLDFVGTENGVEQVAIRLIDEKYTDGRDFALGAAAL